MNRHHLKITSPGGQGQSTEVSLDGEQTHYLTGVTLNIEAREYVTAELRVVMPTIDFEGLADISLPAETVEILTRLGWTPPAEEEKTE